MKYNSISFLSKWFWWTKDRGSAEGKLNESWDPSLWLLGSKEVGYLERG